MRQYYNKQRHRQNWMRVFDEEVTRVIPDLIGNKPQNYWDTALFYFDSHIPARDAAKKYTQQYIT